GSPAHPTRKNNSCGMGRRARPNYFCKRSIVLGTPLPSRLFRGNRAWDCPYGKPAFCTVRAKNADPSRIC
ncbi:hypothetical protein, partial [Microcoleus sp. M2-A5]